MSASGLPHGWARQPQRLRDALAAWRDDVLGDLERTIVVASETCESCGMRPSIAVVVLKDATPFAVCGDCTPVVARRSPFLPPLAGASVLGADVWTARPGRLTVVREPMPTELPEDPAGGGVAVGEWRPRWAGDVPPASWSGRIRLPVSVADIVTSFGLLALVAASSLATYWFSGRDQGAFVRMVVVGVTCLLLMGTVDAFLLGRRDRRRVQRVLAEHRATGDSPFLDGRGRPDLTG